MKTHTIQTLFFILFLSVTQLNAQEYDYVSLYENLEIKKNYALFGDNVNLREKPNTTSKELTRLRIGFEVTVLAKTDYTFGSGNAKTYWYKVRYKNYVGFIPGKFIAHKAIHASTHSLFFSKDISQKYGNRLAIRVLAGNDYSNYQETFSDLRGSLISIDTESNHDLIKVQYILKIQYHGESCGAENGITYFFVKDNYEVAHIADLSSIGDGGFSESETFTFGVNEDNGHTIIIFTQEDTEIIDHNTHWQESKRMTREFAWDGTKLVPEFSNKFYRPEKSN